MTPALDAATRAAIAHILAGVAEHPDVAAIGRLIGPWDADAGVDAVAIHHRTAGPIRAGLDLERVARDIARLAGARGYLISVVRAHTEIVWARSDAGLRGLEQIADRSTPRPTESILCVDRTGRWDPPRWDPPTSGGSHAD